MFQANKAEGRYPNYVSIGWLREDGDIEILATLAGQEIESDEAWNHMVEYTVGWAQYATGNQVAAYARQDAPDTVSIDSEEPASEQEFEVEL